MIINENVQLQRLQNKGYTLEDAKARITAQLSQEEKAKRSDFVIDNSGTLDKTKEQVLARLKLLAQLNQNLHVFFCK